MLEMTAELATPDSLDSLARSEGEEEEEEREDKGLERPDGEEREEENSLLKEEEKDKSSPTIQLASGGQLQVGSGGGVGGGGVGGGGGGGGGGDGSPESSPQIAVSRAVVSSPSPRVVSRPRGVSVCGPRPLRVSVICLVIISVWALLVFIMHLDKKVTTNNKLQQDDISLIAR